MVAAMGAFGALTSSAAETVPAGSGHATPAAVVEKDAHAASAGAAHGTVDGGAHAVAHGLPAAAPVVFHIGPMPVSNSMLIVWIAALSIILFARLATLKMKEIPDGAQNFWELIVESLLGFVEGIVGPKLAKKTFWFFGSVFIFILFTNWFGLIPGVGTVGYGHPNPQGSFDHISEPILRGASADLNMTAAMSLTFMFLWAVWAVQENGFKGVLMHIFAPNTGGKGAMKYVLMVVFALVGVLELISILSRPVSLSFRLFGNVFAGENLLEAMSGLYKPLAFLIPIPFYFLELLVGLIQALVFTLLTAVFTVIMCSHSDHSHDDGHGEKAH